MSESLHDSKIVSFSFIPFLTALLRSLTRFKDKCVKILARPMVLE